MAISQMGLKFYRYNENNEVEVIRLYKIKNQDKFIFRDEFGREIILNKKEFNTYTRINPDGHIAFSIVGLSYGSKDVIVSLHRNKDIENGERLPYCVSRQNVMNVFANQIVKDSKIMHVGVSVSQDTCPADTKYMIMLSCNSVISSELVHIYLDDTLDDVLKFINPLNYNAVLKEIKDNTDEATIIGCNSTLRELLVNTNFWKDFHDGYGIMKIPFHINGEQLGPAAKAYIEDQTKYEILNHVVALYDKDIVLENITHDYLLISDAGNVLSLMVYKKGEYINRPYDALNSHEERDMLAVKK